MKKHLRPVLLPTLLIALAMPVCEALTPEEVLGRVPPNSPQEAEQLYAQVLGAGDALILALCAAIMPPEIGGDTPAQFALYGLTQHVSVPGRDRERFRVARLFEQAFSDAESAEVKRFFLRMLHFCGDGDTARFLAPALADEPLRADVILTLEALGDEGAAVLRSALSNAADAARPPLEAALARMECAADIRTTQDALGDAELLASNPNMWAQSVRRQAEAGNLEDAMRHCRRLLAQDIPVQGRSVVLEVLVDLAGDDAIPEVQAALAGPDAWYRGQALRLAERIPGARASRAWVRALNHADPSLRPRLIALLGMRDDRVARRALRRALADKDAAVRMVAYESVTRHADRRVVADLARAMMRAQDNREMQAIRDALLRMPGEAVADAGAEFARQADVAKRVVGLEIIGGRAADTHLPLVRKSLKDAEPAVRRAALHALGMLAAPEDIERLLDHCVNEPQDRESNAARDALLACAADAGLGVAVVSGAVNRLPRSGDHEPRLLRLLSMLAVAEGFQALRDYALQSAAAGRDASVIGAMEALSIADAGSAHPFLFDVYRALEAEHLRLAAARNFAGLIGRLRDEAAQRDALTRASEAARTDAERAIFSEALAALEKED